MTREQTCPECGRPQRVWDDPEGFSVTYCCQQCAETGACGCGTGRRPDVSARDTDRHRATKPKENESCERHHQ